MASEIRDLIVQLRREGGPGSSYRAIAARLGISVGKVQRELAKAQVEAVAPGSANIDGASSSATRPPAGEILLGSVLGGGLDPEVREARRKLELRKIQLEESLLEARELDAKTRLAALKSSGSGGGGDGALLAYVLSELTRLREGSAAAQGAATKPTSMIDTLQEFRQVGEIVKSFAPPNPVSREDLELQIAISRINAESQRILRTQEEELSIRRRQIEGQAARDDAVAKMIEQFGPVLQAYLTKRIEEGDRKPAGAGDQAEAPALPAAVGSDASASTRATGEVGRGNCPRCGYPPDNSSGPQHMELTATGGPDDKCPGCGAQLGVREGRIVLAQQAAANGSAIAAAGSHQNGSARPASPSGGPPTFTY